MYVCCTYAYSSLSHKMRKMFRTQINVLYVLFVRSSNSCLFVLLRFCRQFHVAVSSSSSSTLSPLQLQLPPSRTGWSVGRSVGRSAGRHSHPSIVGYYPHTTSPTIQRTATGQFALQSAHRIPLLSLFYLCYTHTQSDFKSCSREGRREVARTAGQTLTYRIVGHWAGWERAERGLSPMEGTYC